MNIQIQIERDAKELRINLITDHIDAKVLDLKERIEGLDRVSLTGSREDCIQPLAYQDIYRIFTANGKVFADTAMGEFTLRPRLYELEKLLPSTIFLRISNSEIINQQYIASFDLSIAGTICIHMKNNCTVFASRRYMKRIKQML